MQSVELVSLMSASYLFSLCQALDLRALQKNFLQELDPIIRTINLVIFGKFLSPAVADDLNNKIWTHIETTWLSSSTKDTQDRVTHIVNTGLATLAQILLDCTLEHPKEYATAMKTWKSVASAVIIETYTSIRSKFFASQNTVEYLGQASKRMYLYVRQTLGVPFHKGLEDAPAPTDSSSTGIRKQTTGSWIGIIHESLRDGRLHEPLMQCLREGGLVPVDEHDMKDFAIGKSSEREYVSAASTVMHDRLVPATKALPLPGDVHDVSRKLSAVSPESSVNSSNGTSTPIDNGTGATTPDVDLDVPRLKLP